MAWVGWSGLPFHMDCLLIRRIVSSTNLETNEAPARFLAIKRRLVTQTYTRIYTNIAYTQDIWWSFKACLLDIKDTSFLRLPTLPSALISRYFYVLLRSARLPVDLSSFCAFEATFQLPKQTFKIWRKWLEILGTKTGQTLTGRCETTIQSWPVVVDYTL